MTGSGAILIQITALFNVQIDVVYSEDPIRTVKYEQDQILVPEWFRVSYPEVAYLVFTGVGNGA